MVSQVSRRWRRVALVAVAAVTVMSAACGGDDGESASTSTTPSSGAAQPTTTRAASGGQQTTAAASGTMPDACGFIEDATAAAALGAPVASKKAPQAPSDISTRCDWTGGTYTIALTVRKGSNAKSSFDNTVSSGFTATTLTGVTGADARVSLGARETSRNARLVSYAAYNGTYFVYITLQGPDRADAPATDAAASLVRATLSKLGS
jgi:hypothetical protein